MKCIWLNISSLVCECMVFFSKTKFSQTNVKVGPPGAEGWGRRYSDIVINWYPVIVSILGRPMGGNQTNIVIYT